MSALEGIVRPFETRDVSPPRVVPTTGTPASNLVLNLVSGANVTAVNSSFSETVTFYSKRIRKEQKRKTHTKRVFNPNDSSQWVDVEVIDVWNTKDENGIGQEIEHDIKNTE